jgi:hypothetical protein
MKVSQREFPFESSPKFNNIPLAIIAQFPSCETLMMLYWHPNP